MEFRFVKLNVDTCRVLPEKKKVGECGLSGVLTFKNGTWKRSAVDKEGEKCCWVFVLFVM